ncbi:hypothetical protein AB0F15_18300 [Amycolatopsis sp. NPDC026612]|uniref:hypothetical protein n=1 Tax=Amycolatopsis sp. NPDC026612 TaxID=3155466 RepID=UPI0033CC631E
MAANPKKWTTRSIASTLPRNVKWPCWLAQQVHSSPLFYADAAWFGGDNIEPVLTENQKADSRAVERLRHGASSESVENGRWRTAVCTERTSAAAVSMKLDAPNRTTAVITAINEGLV